MGSQTSSSNRILGIEDSSAIRQQSIFHSYKPHLNARDELIDWNGKPHPHCKTLVDSIGKLSSNELLDLIKMISPDEVPTEQEMKEAVYK